MINNEMFCSNTLHCHLLILILLYIVTVFVILPPFCTILPYSRLYTYFHDRHEMHKTADTLNSDRLNKAQAYFNNLDPNASRSFYAEGLKGDIDIVVAIVTVGRSAIGGGRVGYLTQAAASMDKLIKSDTIFGSKYFFLCNVDLNPENHQEAANLKKYIPHYQRYGNSSNLKYDLTRSHHLYQRTQHGNTYEKETIDYMFCLESAMNMHPKYVLLQEDDTIPCLSLFTVLHNKLTNQKIHSKLSNQDFSHIKLYYPERWQGFSNDLDRLLELLCYGVVGGGLFVFLHFVINIYICDNQTRYYHRSLLYFIFGALYWITVVSLIGRQTVLDARRISPALYYFRESPGCCTPAMLYPLKIIPELIHFLGKDEILYGFHTDVAIYEFVKRRKYPAFQVEPNLFHHTGMYTSLKYNEYKNPQEFLFSRCS